MAFRGETQKLEVHEKMVTSISSVPLLENTHTKEVDRLCLLSPTFQIVILPTPY